MSHEERVQEFWELLIDVGTTVPERPVHFVTRAEVLAVQRRARGLQDVTAAQVLDQLARVAVACPIFPWTVTSDEGGLLTFIAK